eukprot:358829-Chlamydomonas_euryale.AAC.11
MITRRSDTGCPCHTFNIHVSVSTVRLGMVSSKPAKKSSKQHSATSRGALARGCAIQYDRDVQSDRRRARQPGSAPQT